MEMMNTKKNSPSKENQMLKESKEQHQSEEIKSVPPELETDQRDGPDILAIQTLEAMDHAIGNLLVGKVSEPVDLSGFCKVL